MERSYCICQFGIYINDNYKNGKRNGIKYYHVNGSKYVGTLKDNKMNGLGRFYSFEGKIYRIIERYWEKCKRHILF